MFNDKIARFERVPVEQFIKDAKDTFKKYSKAYYCDLDDKSDESVDNLLREFYNNIIIPSRSTYGSAGYDFHMPFPVTLPVYTPVIIPTGIRCVFYDFNDSFNYDFNGEPNEYMKPYEYRGYSLDIYPRSSLGFKEQCYLANTVAIIDEDYYASDNYGHIMINLIKFGPGQSIITKCFTKFTNDIQPAVQPYGNIVFMDGENPFNMQYKYIRGTSIDFDTGDKFAQGIFHEVFAAENDDDTKMTTRSGGIGSTGK